MPDELSPAQQLAAARWQKTGKEARKEVGQRLTQARAKMSAKKRAAAAKKGHETRRKNREKAESDKLSTG